MSKWTEALTTTRELENLLLPSFRFCRDSKAFNQIHALVIKLSLSQSNFLLTKMVDACHALGDAPYARALFDGVAEPNAFLFNAMIRAYSLSAMNSQATALYKQMVRKMESCMPNEFTFPFVLRCCVGLADVSLGRQVHGHVSKLGPKSHYMVDNALMDLYVKCGCLEDGHKVFDEMRERDLVSWNGLISGYALAGRMRKAREMFDEMPERSVVSWTVMISGYVKIGEYSEALTVFRGMQMLGLKPDEISVVSVLPACAQLGALEAGEWVHRYAHRNGFSHKTRVCNALIEMYSKCGAMDRAMGVFKEMPEHDIFSWSTAILGLANHGRAREAIELFREMEKEKVEPNGITFLGVLSACVHAGFWKEGIEYFKSMKRDYRLEPETEHYGCLVDLLGRFGQLDRALETIKTMPVKLDSKIWGSLLSSCRIHGNLRIAEIAMDRLLELEPDDVGNYVLLSNIYADAGKWDDVAKIRKVMRSKSLRRTPGSSSIEVNGTVEEFLSSGVSKPCVEDLMSLLGFLVSHHSLRFEDIIEIMAEDSVGNLNNMVLRGYIYSI